MARIQQIKEKDYEDFQEYWKSTCQPARDRPRVGNYHTQAELHPCPDHFLLSIGRVKT